MPVPEHGASSEDAVEPAGEGQRRRGVQDHQAGGERCERLQAVLVNVAGDGAHSGFQGLRGLVAGRRAEIEKGLASAQIEQRNDCLGADVLHAELESLP